MAEVREVVVHWRVLEERGPVVYVSHARPGQWTFNGQGFLGEPAERFVRIPVTQLLDMDPSLARILDLRPGWHAYRSSATRTWVRRRIPIGKTFSITYETRPTDALEDAASIGGAFVNCWIKSTSIESARRRSRKHLQQTGWVILERLEERAEDSETREEDAEAYFRQAQVDGEVYVIHVYPPRPPDA